MIIAGMCRTPREVTYAGAGGGVSERVGVEAVLPLDVASVAQSVACGLFRRLHPEHAGLSSAGCVVRVGHEETDGHVHAIANQKIVVIDTHHVRSCDAGERVRDLRPAIGVTRVW